MRPQPMTECSLGGVCDSFGVGLSPDLRAQKPRIKFTLLFGGEKSRKTLENRCQLTRQQQPEKHTEVMNARISL